MTIVDVVTVSVCVLCVTVCVLVGNEGKGPIPSQSKDRAYNTITAKKCKITKRKKATNLNDQGKRKITTKKNILFVILPFVLLQINRALVSRDQFAFLDTPILHLSLKRNTGHCW